MLNLESSIVSEMDTIERPEWVARRSEVRRGKTLYDLAGKRGRFTREGLDAVPITRLD